MYYYVYCKRVFFSFSAKIYIYCITYNEKENRVHKVEGRQVQYSLKIIGWIAAILFYYLNSQYIKLSNFILGYSALMFHFSVDS